MKKTIITLLLMTICASTVCAGLFDKATLTRANRYYEEGKYDEAMIEYRRLRDTNPDNALAYYGMGCVWYAVGNYERAADRYKIAVALESRFATAYYWLGNACWKAGSKKEAVQYWQECLRIDPENKDAKLKLKKNS